MIDEVFRGVGGNTQGFPLGSFLRVVTTTEDERVVDARRARITHLADPVDVGDAVSKGWAERHIDSVKVKGDKGDQGEKGEQGARGEKGEKGDSLKPDEVGTLAGRNVFDGAAKGFSYLAEDTRELFIKRSNAAGDWSQPIPFGRGEKGEQGARGEKGEKGDSAIDVLIKDTAKASNSTYSSNKIEELLSTKAGAEGVKELLDKKLDATAKAADSDKLDGLDSSAFARIEQALVKRPLPKGDYTSVGFWRALDSGWYSYNHDSIQGSNNPTPYGFIYVLVEGSDYRVFWYRKNGIEIYSLFFNGSQSSSSSAGWNLISTTLTSGSYASTGVMRTENGDFSGRWISADHFKLKAETQDNLFGDSSELVFRNGAGENENFLRAVSADKFRDALKLFCLNRRNATSVYTASQANPTIDLSRADNFEITLTGSGVLTLNNGIKGQSGVITLSNAATNITGYASNIKWRTTPTSLQATETFAYFVWHDGYISVGRA